jgi:threonine dehydratase
MAVILKLPVIQERAILSYCEKYISKRSYFITSKAVIRIGGIGWDLATERDKLIITIDDDEMVTLMLLSI